MIDKLPSLTEGQLLERIVEPWREFAHWVDDVREHELTRDRFAETTEREAALNGVVARGLFALVEHWDTHGAHLVTDAEAVELVRKGVAAINDPAAFLMWLDMVSVDAAELADRVRTVDIYWQSEQFKWDYTSLVKPGREQMAPLNIAAAGLDAWRSGRFAEALRGSIQSYASSQGLDVDEDSWTTEDGATVRSITLEAAASKPGRRWWRFWRP